MKPEMLKRVAAFSLIVLPPLVLPAFMSSAFTLPKAEVQDAEVAAVTSTPGFDIDLMLKRGGTPIHSGDNFSHIVGGRLEHSAEMPVSAWGKTKLAEDASVWVVLDDAQGKHFLQFPPLEIRAGQWVAANLRPGPTITRMNFIRADTAANTFFSQRAARQEWDAFAELPAGIESLARVDLR